MPASKKGTTKKRTSTKRTESKGSTKKVSRAKRTVSTGKKEKVPAPSPAMTLLTQLMPPVLLLLALLLLICLLSPAHMGLLGGVMRSAMTGLLGGGAYLVPLLLAVIALFFKGDAEKKTVGLRVLYASLLCLFFSVLLQLWVNPDNPHTFDVGGMWQKGSELVGGGALGGVLGEGIYVIMGGWGTPILAVAALIILSFLLFNLTPATLYHAIVGRFRAQREEMARKERLARASAERGGKRYSIRPADPPPAAPRRHLRAVREPTLPPVTGRHAIRVPLDMPDPKEAAREARRRRAVAAEEPAEQVETEREERVLTEDIPISIYGRSEKSERVEPAPAPAVEPEVTAASAPAESVGEEEKEGEHEVLTPLRIRKKQGSFDESEEAGAMEGVISEDVMASFRESQQSRPEGGEVDGSGMITAVDTVTGEYSEGEDEFTLAIRRLSEMEGILPAENRIAEEEEEEPLPPYELPPVTLLREGDSERGKDVSEELNTNAARLVDTLRSFRVRTRLVAISRGPAITRYELAPEEGVKVRSIANLVDDIALNLATSGVRIEAPIPGKSAVGVEVPNQKVELVALRDLIDAQKFRDASSLIMVGLGMDVAGAPIYLDISKMPHLLIAGTTGSGKSVSINCMLVSLLYHASPDQVKLILIDPKKVELNIYNGLPHLLVPVVSDPKKAAGALHWAVTEMERRFEMIEAAGVRDLKHYNAAIEGVPGAEFLPQIVIVIDELADLMMTSKDEVETSICRIAQKARAAGMHLIIGTQRPSVNVVTGVIKANIPSRIAFKVAGQMDSRVILDMVGAEKLIGNGDMLYAPVGCSKPIRVQGAFVSSEEVDEIVSFIKAQSRTAYDAAVISSIDEAAERCSGKRGGEEGDFPTGEGGEGENDPMLKKAIELAVESGKISTSLIQRRLSLGYGRAAKLIDRMEQMGIVGAPEGQKPRQVLISADQYLEMVAGGFADEL